MSIIDMIDQRIRRTKWKQIETSPAKREVIRNASRDVVDAKTDVEEFNAIIRLTKVLP
jgi:hypothetical protein